MANVQGTFYRGETQRSGVTPTSPPNAVDEPVGPLNPPGSNPAHDPVTIGTPANGLSIVGQQLSIGVASSGVTGALSGTKFDEFDAKIGGSLTAGRIPFATGSNTLGDDSGLTWDNSLKSLSLGGFNLAPIHVGNRNVNNSVRSQILISREIFSSSGNDHAFADSSLYSPISNGLAYNSFDARINIGGSSNIDHYAAFQDGTVNNNTGIISNYWGFITVPLSNSGTVENWQHLELRNVGGAGSIGTQYGIKIKSLTKGSSNWSIYTEGVTPSFFGGNIGIGIEPNRKLDIVGPADVLTLRISNFIGDLSSKAFKIGSRPYNNAQIDVSGISLVAGLSTNILVLGGGSASQQAVTNTWFYAASNVNTASGTPMMNLSISGLSVGNGTNISTNTLDVNGTARIRTVSNATGNFVTLSATGVLQQRTAAQTLGDIGGIGGTGTANQIAYFTGASTLSSLSTATYPSLTELSYVKGVTSAIQTQLNGKQATISGTLTDGYVATVVAGVPTWVAPSGGSSNWTVIGSDIYRNSKVLVGATTFTDTTAKFEISGRISQVGLGKSIFIGQEAGLSDDLTNNENIFIGYRTGRLNTIGSYNVYLGNDIALTQTAAYANTYIGWSAGFSNSSGGENSFLGSNSGYSNTTGQRNTYLGVQSGYNPTTGSNNVAIGWNAGTQETSGGAANISNSVYLGYDARTDSSGSTNEIVIGYESRGAGSNTVVLGNTSIILTILRGTINMADLPTSSTGLNSGDVWNNGGVLNIV